MTDKIETVKVVADTEQGYMIINKSDMTDDHTEYKPKATRKAKAEKPEPE